MAQQRLTERSGDGAAKAETPPTAPPTTTAQRTLPDCLAGVSERVFRASDNVSGASDTVSGASDNVFRAANTKEYASDNVADGTINVDYASDNVADGTINIDYASDNEFEATNNKECHSERLEWPPHKPLKASCDHFGRP